MSAGRGLSRLRYADAVAAAVTQGDWRLVWRHARSAPGATLLALVDRGLDLGALALAFGRGVREGVREVAAAAADDGLVEHDRDERYEVVRLRRVA